MSSTAETMHFNENKFRELLLYVASRMLGDPSYGSVKLNKVLFFSDVFHYKATGNPITGAEYIRRRLGPAPRGIREVQDQLCKAKDADVAVLRKESRSQTILFPKRDANLTEFSGQEIATVEAVISVFRDHTADEVSEISHSLQGWKLANEGEVIPYFTIFLYEGPVTSDDIRTAQKVTQELRKPLEDAGAFEAA